MRNPKGRRYTAEEDALIISEWARLSRLTLANRCLVIGGKMDRQPRCILARAARLKLYRPVKGRGYVQRKRLADEAKQPRTVAGHVKWFSEHGGHGDAAVRLLR